MLYAPIFGNLNEQVFAVHERSPLVDAKQTLDRFYLEMRRDLLELAAGFDRFDRASSPDSIKSDPRLQKLRQAAIILADGASDRAERIQMLFSDSYEAEWRERFAITK